MKSIPAVLLLLLCSLATVLGQSPDSGSPPSASPTERQPEAGGARAREFQGDDLPQVARLLARQAKVNLAVGEAIKGSVTAFLANTTAFEALEIIAKQHKLSLIKDDKGTYYLDKPDANPAFDALAKPETANKVARYIHNLYAALLKEGFNHDEALRIVLASDVNRIVADLADD